MLKSHLLSLALTIGLASPALACMTPSNSANVEQGIVTWVNKERRAHGLGPLTLNNSLGKAANAHACDMAKMDKLTHTSSNGGDLSKRLRKVGYRLSTAVENIARSGTTSAEKARELWINSPAHKTNLLNPRLTEMGLGIAHDGTRAYYVFVGGQPR